MSKNKILFISVLSILIGATIASVFLLPKSAKTPLEKTIYTKQYDVGPINSVSGLTPQSIAQYKEKFNEYQDKLEKAVKDYKKGGEKMEERPNPDFFIEKARYAQYLDQTDWAIAILKDVFNYYQNSSVAWNNLAKLYEAKKDYQQANQYYLKIVQTFGEKAFWGEYYYITKNYIILGDKAKVKEYYQKYQSFGGQDSEIETYLTKQP